MVELATELLADIISASLPIAIVFEIGNLLVGTFLRAAFGGRLWFGSR